MSGEVIKDDLEIIGILKGLSNNKTKLWCWQDVIHEDGTKERVVHYVIIQKVDPIKKVFHVRPNVKHGFRFVGDAKTFILAKERAIAFSFVPRDVGTQYMMIAIPTQVTPVKAEFIQSVELVERENEGKHQHLRAAERKQITSTKMVGIRKYDNEGLLGILDFHFLYDLSAGGLSFRVEDPAEFFKDERIVAVSIDGKNLANPYRLIVRSIREMEDGKFKVGCQFIKD
ncbi:PilZ domain-containing protein [Bacteriovorax sp. Seq25_V]|uniref:PilZ domain-containing protein n=1 Tax=Bacteriovorax sp. Seq25_V TaxID=1201288 RepID=UPI000389DAC6|nr:PilZ domain-containing protein [Bacteriovorax sp. Seq25_V]EQC44219.1 type IV pilus assembly domain protein [Bacteriovorax sp. Seq25_V]